MRLLILSLISLITLSGCLFYHEDQTCGQICEMTPDKTDYILGNTCNAPNITVPSQYVQSCYSCSEKNLSRYSSVSLALSYPDFVPLPKFSSEKREEKISIWITPSPCTSSYDGKNSQPRSQVIKEFLKARQQSERSQFSTPTEVAENLYVIKNSAEFSADEEIFYYKNLSDDYDFVTICHSYGCSSVSNPVEKTPYTYEYNFFKPSKIEDIFLIHQSVKIYVSKIHEKTSKFDISQKSH